MSFSSPANGAVRQVQDAAREVAPWIELLARIGYSAKALLYATVGILAARAALGDGGRTTDVRGALRALMRAPFGDGILIIIAVGLAGYAIWCVVDAVTDAEGHGKDLKGVGTRVGRAFRGLAHGALALAAFHLATGSGDGSAGGTRRIVARLMDLPGGEWLVRAVALGVLGYGVYQLYRAYAAKLGSRLNLGQLPSEAARWVIGICRSGIAARGVIFGMIGILLMRAAAQRDPSEAGGLRESLEVIAGMGGRWAFASIALGLVAYALYELLNARYRVIRVA